MDCETVPVAWMKATWTPSGAADGTPVNGLFIPLIPPPFANVHEPPLGEYWKFPLPITGASKPALGTVSELEAALLGSSLKLSYLAVPGLLFPVPYAPAISRNRKAVSENPGVTVLRVNQTESLALVSKWIKF